MDSRMQLGLRLFTAIAAAAPAMAAELALAPGARGQTLPPPPYAAAAQGGGPAGAQAYDRYGAGMRMAPVAHGLSPTFSGASLNWSGKVDVPAASGPAAAGYGSPAPRSAYLPAGYPSPPARSQAQAQTTPLARAWTYAAQPGQPASPASIYDPPPSASPAPAPAPAPTSASPPVAIAQATAQPGDGPRHYSVHRDYGIEPDPIPLPPQFFGATADLSQAATADPMHRPTTAAGKTQNALQPADGQ